MKIPASVRNLYDRQRPTYEKLEAQVDRILRPVCNSRRWHYESRVKAEMSIALKLESGRVSNTEVIEDFFACTMVVRNLAEINVAEQEVRRHFNVVERRPQDVSQTHKTPDAFPFDDLRLYALWQDDPDLPPTGLDGKKFEVQVKTFLQHAWGIATHDLVYKTDDVSWSKQRIAYQIKAMLEHAEISIQEADRLAATSALAKTQKETESLKDIIAVIKEAWEPEFLPPDLRRLAENTWTVMRLAGIKLDVIKSALAAERARLKGSLPINLSPYAIIVQALAWHVPDKMRGALADRQKKAKILVTSEMELPDWMLDTRMINVVHVG